MKALGIASLLALLLCLTSSPATPVSTAASPVVVPFVEIERGEVSGFRYNVTDFAGAELHIADRSSWQGFWNLHTQGMSPTPPLPGVRFPQESVIVVLLGYQTTGGGPSIAVQSISRSDRSATIEVAEDHTPGPLDVITNPYQIIVLPSLGRSLTFAHTESSL